MAPIEISSLFNTIRFFLEDIKTVTALPDGLALDAIELQRRLYEHLENTHRRAAKNAVKMFLGRYLHSILDKSRRSIVQRQREIPERLFPNEDYKLWLLRTTINYVFPNGIDFPADTVYAKFIEVFGREEKFNSDIAGLQKAQSAASHEISIGEVDQVKELRRIPSEYRTYIKISAARHNIPEYLLVYSIFVGDVFKRKYPVWRGLEILANRRGIKTNKVEILKKILPKRVLNFSDEYLLPFIAAMAGGKTTIGMTKMRPSWVRRSDGFAAFGIDATKLNDQEISWLLLIPEYSIEAAAAMWRTSIDWVKSARVSAIEGRLPDVSEFLREASVETEPVVRNPSIARYIPDPQKLGSNEWVLTTFHPQSEWFVAHGLGVEDEPKNNKRYLLQHDLKVIALNELICRSGILDDKPGIIIGASEVQLRRLANDKDAYIRNAARRMLLKNMQNVNRRVKAMSYEKGGIDLTTANMNLETRNAGQAIKFNIDPAMLKQLQNAPGFVPVIISIQPMVNLRKFLDVA